MTSSTTPLKVSFGNMRIAHHATHSGYHLFADRIAELVDASPLGETAFLPELPAVGMKAIRKLLRGSGREWYDDHALSIEADALRALRSSEPNVVHLLWGESYYRWAGMPPSRGGRLIVTFHQPPGVLVDIGPSVRQLRALDGVMTLAHNQTEFFTDLLGRDRVFQVPHGVDTGFFNPDGRARDDATCVVVGQWLRDNDTLLGAAKLLAERAPDVRIKLVGSKQKDPELLAVGNVEYLPRITDEELRDLYRASSMLLLPLHDSTANCGLLEGLATGTPIVCSDVGGVRDYVDDACAAFAPAGDAEALASTVTSVLGDSARRAAMAEAAAARSARFAWERVSAEAVTAYRALLR